MPESTSAGRSSSLRPWTPDSWRQKPALQQPVYADESSYQEVLRQLAHLPPLVTSWEVLALKRQLAEAAAGGRFVLQGGDCAERFEDCTAPAIVAKLKILLKMSLVLVLGGRKPVTRIGRLAGQYAKPRSEEWEVRDGVRLPSYRGDLVNRAEFSAAARQPDPELLLRGYERAALTLNFVRALVKGGFADLQHPEYWDLGFAHQAPLAEEYRRLTESLSEALHFMKSILGADPLELHEVDFFSSHEALHLGYEQAHTRQAPQGGGWFNLSTHFPWLGMRTAKPEGAHVEYLRGIKNPLGVKVGPVTDPEDILRIADLLDPGSEPGRLTLIHRYGVREIEAKLPTLIRRIRATGRRVLWMCDPMHGNSRTTPSGLRTRLFEDILGELELAFDIHAAEGSRLGGVHFELTGEDVTECIGGARGLTLGDLSRNYQSEVDPRLNYEQSLEMALLIARKMRQMVGGEAPPADENTSFF